MYQNAALLAALLLIYSAVAGRAERSLISGPIVFTGVGFILGADGLGYKRRCALTRERTLPILDAARIRAFADGGWHEITNGLLLRTDIHRLSTSDM
jgi:hypothetical protein